MAQYTMPPLTNGDTVVYYPEGEANEQNGRFAFCTGVDVNTALLNVIEWGRSNFQCRECVRHVDDPWFKDFPHHRKQYGAWDYSPQMKRIMALESLLQEATKPKGGK